MVGLTQRLNCFYCDRGGNPSKCYSTVISVRYVKVWFAGKKFCLVFAQYRRVSYTAIHEYNFSVQCCVHLVCYFILIIFFVFFPFHFGDQFLIKLAAQRYRVPFYAKPLLIHHVQEIHYGILNINRFLIPLAGSFSQNRTLPRHVWLDSHRLLLHLPLHYAMLYAIASS